MGREMTEPAHGVSNMVLYSLLSVERLDDDIVYSVAERAIVRPDGYRTTQQMYTGIAEALRSDDVLTAAIPNSRHGEDEYRDFLRRLLQRLDELRPWPEQPFLLTDPELWYDIDHARLIGRVKLSVTGVQRRVRVPFGKLWDRLVMTLRLRSGAEVALVADWWPDSKDVALLERDPRLEPADVLAEFCIATGITPDEIAVADQ